MELALITLVASIIFYSYAVHLRKKASKAAMFDKQGKLTAQAHFTIQRGVRKDSTFQ